jgi:multimeric flavodoxin WrbA
MNVVRRRQYAEQKDKLLNELRKYSQDYEYIVMTRDFSDYFMASIGAKYATTEEDLEMLDIYDGTIFGIPIIIGSISADGIHMILVGKEKPTCLLCGSKI